MRYRLGLTAEVLVPAGVLMLLGIFVVQAILGPDVLGDSRRSSRRIVRPAPGPVAPATPTVTAGTMVVLGYNELGMHCMNQDFSELCILPPYNNLHAQVIKRSGEHPEIVKSGVTVSYSIPGNTKSSTKTNFWAFAPALFGVNLPLDIGLTGHGLSGTLSPTPDQDWVVTGVPNTPINDLGRLDAYQLAQLTVTQKGKVTAQTATVVPVSWEISCNLCHNTPGVSVAHDILAKHDARHGTTLVQSKPVLCAGCHADPALGTKGVPGVSSLSHAMHGSHADRIQQVNLTNSCYACHPGFQTNCQRDVHYTRGIHCTDCHGGMAQVADPARTPWVDEPRCGTCHQSRKPRFAFEEPGKLFKESRGHHGVHCAACHGSPHAITPVDPSITNNDNIQAIALQGFAGTIRKCTVCHSKTPDDPFDHRLDDD